ncbi:MAG: LysR substrate-binding domain-containing protein [Candidatus Dormibacteraceae bacterium]
MPRPDLDRAVTLHQLRTFRAVVDRLSFSAAAVELHLRQSSVSYQVKELEEALDVVLLDRLGKRVVVTEAGKVLYEYARQMLNLLDEAALAIDQLHGLERGTLRVGGSTTVGIYVLPIALGAFKKLHQGVAISLEIGSREALQAKLLADDLDVAVMAPPVLDPELEFEPLMDDELVLVVPAGHRLGAGRGLRLQDFAGEPFLMREPQSGTRIAVEQLAMKEGVTLQVAMELGSNGAIKHAVEGGLGVAVLSRHAVTLERSAGGLVVVDVEGFPIRREWGYVLLRRRHMPSVLREFVDFLARLEWLRRS